MPECAFPGLGEMTRHRGKVHGASPRAPARGPVGLRPPPSSNQQPFALYRLAVQLPLNSLGFRFSRAHPELTIDIQNRMEVDLHHLLMEVKVLGPGAGEHVDEIRKFPGVVDVQVHIEGPAVAQYRLTEATSVAHEVVRLHRILTRYPLRLKDGWLRFETVAHASQIRHVVRDLRRRVGPTNVEAVRRGKVTLGSLGLSLSQETVFRTAIHAGYYDVPRRISVTDLAMSLGKSKSTVSEALGRISKRLTDSALQMAAVPLATVR